MSKIVALIPARSGSKGVKDAISITDKGSVLEANSSIIDFLHNFNNN